MKKYIIRLIGALCIIAAMATAFFPAWVQIDDVSGKEMRTFRKQMDSELERVESWLCIKVQYDYIREDLKDNDLPYRERAIKSRIKKSEELLDQLTDENISLQDVLLIAVEAPQYIEDTDNLLYTDYVAETLFAQTLEYTTYEWIEEIIENVKPFQFVFPAVVVFFGLIGVLGILAAVMHVMNKGRYVKYIFLGFFLGIAVGVCIAVPIASDFIQTELYLPETVEDMTLKTTVMPYLSIALAFVPVVLDIIFERKKTNKLEA